MWLGCDLILHKNVYCRQIVAMLILKCKGGEVVRFWCSCTRSKLYLVVTCVALLITITWFSFLVPQTFLSDLCEVPDFHEQLQLEEYIAASRKDISIEISLSEIALIQSFLLKYRDSIVSLWCRESSVLSWISRADVIISCVGEVWFCYSNGQVWCRKVICQQAANGSVSSGCGTGGACLDGDIEQLPFSPKYLAASES